MTFVFSIMAYKNLGTTDRQLIVQKKKSSWRVLHYFLYPILIALVINSFITGKQELNLPPIFDKKLSPYELYSQKLDAAEMYGVGIGKDWLEAGQKALQDSLVVDIPYQENGYVAKEEMRAVAYVMEMKDGEVLEVEMEVVSEKEVAVFLDLFRLREGRPHRFIAYADSGSTSLRYEIRDNGTYLLRVQSELMRSFEYTIKIQKQPQLAFPVQGKDASAVGSFWGAPRDGGRRKHKGIDIFAAKGTPVLAASEGVISRVRNGGLGGKTVWLRDNSRSQSLYYAHLDTQMVRRGDRVRIGDTLGLVGNTGNARYTPPHLHFGIYRSNRGAVDPYPHVFEPKHTLSKISDTYREQLNAWVQPKSSGTRFFANKSSSMLLDKGLPLKVLAINNKHYRVQHPNGLEGFVSNRDVMIDGAEHVRIDEETFLIERPYANAAVKTKVEEGKWVKVLGEYMEAKLVSIPPQGRVGWMLN